MDARFWCSAIYGYLSVVALQQQENQNEIDESSDGIDGVISSFNPLQLESNLTNCVENEFMASIIVLNAQTCIICGETDPSLYLVNRNIVIIKNRLLINFNELLPRFQLSLIAAGNHDAG